jgi:geranylgeranyl pyrophosphate synthase
MRAASTQVAESLRALAAGQAWPAAYARLVEDAVLPGDCAPSVDDGITRWPALVLACAATCGPVSEEAVQAAVATALLMAAFDVFDDGEDSELAPEADAAVLVNVGTGLLLLFHQVCCTPSLCMLPAPGVRALVEAALRACGGQHSDLSRRADSAGMRAEEAVTITAAKSAALVAALCRMGALTGGARGLLLARYAAFGYHLGMATQMANDLSAVQGGPVHQTDLAYCRPTLPLVYAAQQTGAAWAGTETLVPVDALGATWVVLQVHRLRALRALDTIERTYPARALLEPFLP